MPQRECSWSSSERLYTVIISSLCLFYDVVEWAKAFIAQCISICFGTLFGTVAFCSFSSICFHANRFLLPSSTVNPISFRSFSFSFFFLRFQGSDCFWNTLDVISFSRMKNRPPVEPLTKCLKWNEENKCSHVTEQRKSFEMKSYFATGRDRWKRYAFSETWPWIKQ